MTRPSEYTRQNILKAAIALFAERGYDGTSIRAIVSKARVNQAAINYHFKGKEGLYFEVLKVAFESYLRLDNFDLERLKDMPREEALRSFVHQQLRPLLARDQMSRCIRIFAWENVRPSKVLTNFVSTGAMPFLLSLMGKPVSRCRGRGTDHGLSRFTAGTVSGRHQIPVIYRRSRGLPDRVPGGSGGYVSLGTTGGGSACSNAAENR